MLYFDGWLKKNLYMPIPSVFSKSVLWKAFHDEGDNKKNTLADPGSGLS